MNQFRTICSRLRSICQRREVKREFDEELRFHIEQRTVENMAAGMAPEDAAREARKRFGNLQSVREECREQRGAGFGETAWQDIRFAVRMLRKNPGFTFAAVAILALGISANTTLFSFYNALFLKPLPYGNAGRIVMFSGHNLQSGSPVWVSPPDLQDWREQNRSFEGIGAYRLNHFILSGGHEPSQLLGMDVSVDFLSVLGLTPNSGRVFSPDEYKKGNNRVVMISHKLWLSQFEGRNDVIGKVVQMDDLPHVIVGVLPQAFQMFRGWNEPLVIRPMDLAALGGRRSEHSLPALALLKPDVSIPQAQADMTVITERLANQYPDSNRHYRVKVEKHYGLAAPAGRVRVLIGLQMAAAFLVLLIVCANLTNLLLARAAAREKEMAVRAALGAGRWRMVRQLLSECLCLALLGGGIGLGLACLGIKLCDRIMVVASFEPNTLRLDPRGLLFTLAVSLGSVLVFGLAPALSGSKVRLTETLKGLGASAGSLRKRRMRSTLVAGQIAVSMALTICSGLLFKSLANTWSRDLGYNTRNILTMQVSLTESHYAGAQDQARFFSRVVERVAALPGVECAGVSSALPTASMNRGWGLEVVGAEPALPGEHHTTEICLTSPQWFETLGIVLKRGRPFSGADHARGRPVAIINETAARAHWGGRDPLGTEIKIYGNHRFEVIGVTADTKPVLDDAESMVFLCHAQAQDWIGCETMTVATRTTIDPEALIRPSVAAIRELDSRQPISQIQTLSQAVEVATGEYAMIVGILSSMGVFSLVLALFGNYSFISHLVSLRTREIGIRLALGADRGTIVRQVLGQSRWVLVAGVIAGVLGALAASRLLNPLLFGVPPTDGVIFVGVPVLLIASTLLATCLPAWRAARVDPMTALRSE